MVGNLGIAEEMF